MSLGLAARCRSAPLAKDMPSTLDDLTGSLDLVLLHLLPPPWRVNHSFHMCGPRMTHVVAGWALNS